jgi:hypothetical protein
MSNVPAPAPKAPKAPAAPTQSTKPGAEAPKPKKKREKVIRAWHPALKPSAEDGKPTVKLEAVPADYNPKVHKPLKRVHFTNEAVLLDYAAERLEKKAKALRAEAHEARTTGGNGTRTVAKQMRKYMEKLAAMTEQLKAQGIDPNEFLKGLDS